MQELGLKEYFAIGYYFVGEEKKIPLVLDAYAKNQLDLSDVNRVLELSSIKEFFDKYDYVNAWNDDYYRKYKELSRNAEKEVRLFFQSITENAIVPIYNVCKVIFWDEFWKYFYIYKVYDKISAEHFKEIADGLRIPPNELLKNKNLVEKFDTQITEMLKNPEYGARFIVDYYMRKDNGKTKCYFPKSLTKEDKYNIIKAYINGDIVNINILDLIINGKSKKSKEFDVDAKLRHLAKKRSERYWNNNTTSVFEYETGVEVSFSPEKKYTKARSDLYKKVAGIASVANIPEIQAQADFINKILSTDYVEQAGIAEFEEIRERLRNLIKYIPKNIVRYDTNFEDDLLSIEWKDSELENDELKNYKAKAEYYIRQHQDNIAIAKLKTNQPLTATDIETLEEILWREVGTKQDYENEFGTKPLGEFVREIVGLDMNAANTNKYCW